MEGKWVVRTFFLVVLIPLINGCCKRPIYQPAFWNDGGTIQRNNNCYNYGNNKRTDTFAQPGRATGAMYPLPIACVGVYNAAKVDGLEPLTASGTCPKNRCSEQDKVALVVSPVAWFNDYHWYRQDKSNMWSHKPGRTRATDLDNSGNPISSPETANRGLYTDFCGYMCSCSNDQEGNGREKIN